jgi:acylaminoacyl-peptidase
MKGRNTTLRLAAILFIFAPAVWAAGDPAAAMERLSRVRDFEQVAISPDGSQVVWVEILNGPQGTASRNTAIYCQRLDTANSAPQRIRAIAGRDASEHKPLWAPDSKGLVFLSDAEQSGQAQVYLSDCAGHLAKRVSSFKGFLADPLWSADGKALAVLLTEGAAAGADPLEASPARVGEIGEQAAEQRIAVLNLNAGTAQIISPADMYIYEYDWSPDGKTFVATAASGSGQNNWWIAQLYLLPASGGKMTAIYKPPLQIAIPRWSPDGQSIAFIGGLMSDEVSTGGDVFLLSAKGGEPKNLTPGIRASASAITWTDAGHMVMVANSRGRTVISRLESGNGRLEELWSGDEFLNSEMWMGSVSIARDGMRVAAVRSSFDHPPEVVAGPIGKWRAITSLNSGVKPEWGKFQTVEWKNEGFDVQGWLVFPPDYDPSKRYPLVVVVHGGPASVQTTAWPKHFFQPLLLSGQGYFLFFPNPRGSFGQGEEFTKANVKDFGGGDLRDILAGVDAVVGRFPVDAKRVGLTGWSYGGFMAMLAVARTQRFAASVAGAGISNWQSYYGENEIDQWMIPYFGASVYDDPAVYAKASAINFVHNVHTPTLIVVGERDAECPAPQSFEFWHALKTVGTPTSLVVYSGEGHHFNDPAHRKDVNLRMIDWFHRYLRPETQ